MSEFLSKHIAFQASPEVNTRAMDPRPLSITELTQKIKRLLETQLTDVLVEGEISGFKGASSGHLYFDLKDSGAIIHCVVWASDAGRLRFNPSNGAKVEARGRLTVYDQRGQYQLSVTHMRPAGLGKLYQAFIEMKERLATEGLFDQAHKKAIPAHPRSIGLVTSPTGAAIRDMLNILARRAPHIHVYIWPARVQGDTAAKEVAGAIRRFNSMDSSVDVLIVGRGGGSLEDLWAFNEEVVARAIWDSQIPVISAVGHETDTTIADFVADLRAPTPSAAAELVARDSTDLIKQLGILQSRAYRALREQSSFLRQGPHLRSRLESAFLPRIQGLQAQLKEFERSYGIQMPLQRVNQTRQQHDELMERLNRNITDKLRNLKNHHQQIEAHLGALNPKAILKRGYSITYSEDTASIISRANEVSRGASLKIILGEGQLAAVVDGTPNSRRAPVKSSRKKRGIPPAIEWFGSDSDDSET